MNFDYRDKSTALFNPFLCEIKSRDKSVLNIFVDPHREKL